MKTSPETMVVKSLAPILGMLASEIGLADEIPMDKIVAYKIVLEGAVQTLTEITEANP